MTHMGFKLAAAVLWIVTVVSVSGCAQPKTLEAEPVLTWPAAPSSPRIKYVRSFSAAQDLGITPGFFRRLAEIFTGPDLTQLVRPTAVVAISDTEVYVADPGVKGVHRFDLRHGRHAVIRRAEGQPLPSPVGLALGLRGEIFVTDSLLQGVFRIVPGADGAQPFTLHTDLSQPTGIAVARDEGLLYVVDTSAHDVKIFDESGALVGRFGGRGMADGEFNFPTMIWRKANGELFVTDSLNFRVQQFDGTGKFQNKFGRPGDGTGDLSRPKGIATDRLGHIYVVDALFHAVQIFNPTGTFLLAVGGHGREAGEFWLPTGIFVSGDDKIYVADSYNQRVQIFQYIGGGE
ncbi:MAG: 6-bladed beta-propeller [Gammaproteobacteria bacterium]|nr:6-bladed beta-propeller [Gammaproteobacteria bacterium]